MIFRDLNLYQNLLAHYRSIKPIEFYKKMTLDECIYFFQESTNIKEIFIDSTNNCIEFYFTYYSAKTDEIFGGTFTLNLVLNNLKILEICNEIVKYNISIICFKIAHFTDILPNQRIIVLEPGGKEIKQKQKEEKRIRQILERVEKEIVKNKKENQQPQSPLQLQIEQQQPQSPLQPQIEQQQINLVIENINQELKSNKFFQRMIEESYKQIPSQYQTEWDEKLRTIFDFRGNKKLINSLTISILFCKSVLLCK